ncbi:copper chaperone PCu(A)C [Ornithinimicrobium sp. LYQ121]|uniref:copper chaperone PCu(A)C n=1 Tax=Ornithinimicrobium sp. LYQ121 TaxID=3378801 RepID=UPI0038554596
MPTPRPVLPALALSVTLALVGCGADATPTSVDGTSASSPSAAATTAATALTLEDGWAKATDAPMTGVFGTLTNSGGTEIHLVSVRSELAGMAELHVTVDDGAGGRVMREAEDGFTIPAGGEHDLVPGGDHLMLMQLTGPVETGQEVALTLLDEDGREYAVTVTARAFSGAEEDYDPEPQTEQP